jgi:chromosome segregation ATPase
LTRFFCRLYLRTPDHTGLGTASQGCREICQRPGLDLELPRRGALFFGFLNPPSATGRGWNREAAGSFRRAVRPPFIRKIVTHRESATFVAVDCLASPVGWETVESTLAGLRAEHGSFADLARQQLGELEALRSGLEERAREVARQQRETRRRLADLESDRVQIQEHRRTVDDQARQLTERQACLVRSQAELEAARAEFFRLRDAESDEIDAATAERLGQLTALERQREELTRELSAAQDQLARLAETTEQLARSRGELAESERRRMAVEEELTGAQRQISRLADAAAELAAARAALAEARVELSRRPQREDAEAEAAVAAISQQLSEVQRERAILDQSLTAAREQIGRLVDTTAELAAVRGELADARSQLLARNASHADGAELERQLAERDRERELLETELETVRRRVVEMAESAAAEKRQFAAERAEWSDEIKQLRKSIERQLPAPGTPPIHGPASAHEASPMHRGASMHVPVPPPVAPPGSPAIPPRPLAAVAVVAEGDPLLDSVVAQFDLLQKDMARRRSGTKKTGAR